MLNKSYFNILCLSSIFLFFVGQSSLAHNYGESCQHTLENGQVDQNNVKEILKSLNIGFNIKKIVLDPGHGGKDGGCIGHNSNEKDIVLNIALELGALIQENHPHIEIIYTRKTDRFIPLHQRIELANSSNADLFISIHCNASKHAHVSGSETFVMGVHNAQENLEVAKRENASILLEEDYKNHYEGYSPESEMGHIILSMYQNAYLEQSISLAQKVEYSLNRHSLINSRGVKQAGFVVLRKATMPSVLIEAGFLTNPEDAKLLNSKSGQREIAESIYEAFENYKSDIERNSIASFRKERLEEELELLTEEDVENLDLNQPKPKIEQKYEPLEALTVSLDASNIKYKVQIAASKSRSLNRSSEIWNNIEDLVVVEESGLFKYLAGNFSNLETALIEQDLLREKGFKGAFVVVYKDNERISLEKAQEFSMREK